VVQGLTVLLALKPGDLRRAVVEPSKRQGYTFEDQALVEEVVASVEGARGALPLLAFAVSRLWEMRDRETKHLTREAYEEIGGVAGALAQHAEQTLERIGLEREPIVRELFCNLVTAQWTRAVADREELLSVLPDPEAGAQVLDQLINARLLTAYEVEEGVGETQEAGRHWIEIVHESLLKAWPRLVRWQAQDEEGAVLRDQLKQAAHLWEERGRPDALLWTGTSEREFALWRDRYPGRLTALEDDFAGAMAAHAQRRRRRRRAAIATVVASLAAGLVVVAVLWGRAVTEAHQREAAELLALGRLELEDHPTAGLAYALASLERADSSAARRFALETLAHGAAALVIDSWVNSVAFSQDGRWLATGGVMSGAYLWSREGGAPVSLGSATGVPHVQFDPEAPLLSVQGTTGATAQIFSVPDRHPIQEVETQRLVIPRGSRLFTFWRRGPVHVRPVGEGEPRLLGHLDEVGTWHFSSSGARGSPTLAIERSSWLGWRTWAPRRAWWASTPPRPRGWPSRPATVTSSPPMSQVRSASGLSRTEPRP
jgi:hypothetical protein